MKKLILMIFIVIIISTLSGCNQTKKKTPSKETNTVETANEITEKDIEEGKQVINRYFTAIKDKDIDEINKTLGIYKKDLYNKVNIDDWAPILISINYPGKYTNDNIPPESYKANYGKDPYKSMNFNVTYKDGDEEKNWDYILVKESKDSSWEIHDWGY
mgnify:CR=1 FL=1